MLQSLSDMLGGIPISGVIALIVLVVIQITLQLVAFADLARRQRVLYDRKWMWGLIILFGQLLGAIIYLAIAREPDPVADLPAAPDDTRSRSQKAVDVLYESQDQT